jgi:general secretion pathway protein L
MSPRQSHEETQDARDALAELSGRWRTELARLMHELRQRFVSSEALLPTLLFEDGAVVVRSGLDMPEARVAHAGGLPPAQVAETLARLLGSQTTPKDVALVFPESRFLRLRVALPNGRSGVLRKVLGYELERLSPINANENYFDFKKSAAVTSMSMREIDVRVVRRDVVDVAIATCMAANLRVGAIEFAGDDRPADWRALPVDRSAFARQLWRRWNAVVLAGAALLLGLMLIFAAYARGAEEREAVLSAVAQERERAAVVEHLRQQIRAAVSSGEIVSPQKNSPMLVSILADVSRILPDNTWVTQMTLSEGKLRLEGYSHASSDLIVLFDKSGRFANAQFVAPVTRDEQTKLERFDISFDVRAVAR